MKLYDDTQHTEVADDVCTACAVPTRTTSGMYNLVSFTWFLGKYLRIYPTRKLHTQ